MSDENKQTLEPYIKANGIKYPVASDPKDITGQNYKADGIPHAFLIGGKGTILWRGHPASVQGPLQEALKGLLLYFDRTLGPAFKDVEKALKKSKYGEAQKALKKLVDGGKLGATDLTDAQATQADLDRLAADRQAEAAGLLEQGEVYGAHAAYEDLAKAFDGTETGDKAEAEAKRIKSDKALKPELEAGEGLAKGKKCEDAKAYQQAFSAYKKVVSGHKGTKAADTAKARMQQLVDSGKLYYRQDCAQCRQAGKACKGHDRR